MSTDQTKETITLFDNEYQVVDYYDGLITIKEFKDYLSQMEEDLYFQLRDDIKTNGMHDPILYLNYVVGKNSCWKVTQDYR